MEDSIFPFGLVKLSKKLEKEKKINTVFPAEFWKVEFCASDMQGEC